MMIPTFIFKHIFNLFVWQGRDLLFWLLPVTRLPYVGLHICRHKIRLIIARTSTLIGCKVEPVIPFPTSNMLSNVTMHCYLQFCPCQMLTLFFIVCYFMKYVTGKPARIVDHISDIYVYN